MRRGCGRRGRIMSPTRTRKWLKYFAIWSSDAKTSELVAALPALGLEIVAVVRVEAGVERHALGDGDPGGLQPGHLARVVCEQPDAVLAELTQHGGGDAEIPLVVVEAEA